MNSVQKLSPNSGFGLMTAMGYKRPDLSDKNGNNLATCVDFLLLSPSEIEMYDRANQSRAEDIKTNNLQKLQADIEHRGLVRPVLVECDEISGKYILISGHHRLTAITNLDWETVPVFVIKISNALNRIFLCQKENNHCPALAHGEKDAVKFLCDLRNNDGFRQFGKNYEKMRAYAYELLNEHYPFLHTVKKKGVWTKFKKTFTTASIRSWASKSERANENLLLGYDWPLGACKNGVFYFNSSTGNLKKNLGDFQVKLNSRIMELEALGSSSVEREMKNTVCHMIAYTSKTSRDTVTSDRSKFLEEMAHMNSNWYVPLKKGTITKIIFMKEVILPKKETAHIVYNWDFKKRKFVKQSK